MTVAVFLGSLLAVMALGIPIAYSLLLCGVSLMWHLNTFDPQIVQVGGAPRLDVDPLTLRRNHSRMPGDGDLDVPGFLRVLEERARRGCTQGLVSRRRNQIS
jgi:hypothetical protein